MKSFYHYLAESAKTYKFRIKSVQPMDAEFVSTLKRALFKYDITTVSKPKKLMAQKAPLDFKDYDMAEIWIVDIQTSVPASSYAMACELRGALRLADSMLVVRSENDPLELEAQRIEQINKDDETKAVLDDPMYENEDQPKEVAFGDAYNKKFLDYLAQSKANAEGEAKDIPAVEEIRKTQKFAWLNPKNTAVADDFNAEFDAVKPVHSNSKKPGKKAVKPNLTSNTGNYDELVKRKG
jgi:hypothetical protein